MRTWMALGLALVASNAAHAGDKGDCKKARKALDPAPWEDYLKAWPEGECVAEANIWLELDACEAAVRTDDLVTWQEHLERWPLGGCSKVAEARVAALEPAEQACAAAKASKEIDGWIAVLRAHPVASCAADARARVARSWGAQPRKLVVDAVRAWPGPSPGVEVEELARTALATCGIDEIDKGFLTTRVAFSAIGEVTDVHVVDSDLAVETKSCLVEALAKVELLPATPRVAIVRFVQGDKAEVDSVE